MGYTDGWIYAAYIHSETYTDSWISMGYTDSGIYNYTCTYTELHTWIIGQVLVTQKVGYTYRHMSQTSIQQKARDQDGTDSWIDTTSMCIVYTELDRFLRRQLDRLVGYDTCG